MTLLKSNREAMKWVVRNFGAKVLYPYIDRVNVTNFKNKVVGFICELQGEKFLLTFRPRGITIGVKGIGAVTGFNSSELHFQREKGMDRIVVFNFPKQNKVKAYVFRTQTCFECIHNDYAMAKDHFATYPNEDERVWNVPVKVGINLETMIGESGG